MYEELLQLAYKIAAFIMSYSFTRPEPEEVEKDSDSSDDDEDEGIRLEKEATVTGNALLEVPVMIPVADFLNASINKNNAKLHWNEDDESLRMMSTKFIPKVEC